MENSLNLNNDLNETIYDWNILDYDNNYDFNNWDNYIINWNDSYIIPVRSKLILIKDIDEN